jgi:hypothetical protein
MCAATDCVVLSHASVKVTLDTREYPMDTREYPMDWDFMFIQSTTKKAMDTLAVFVKPRVPALRLGFWLTW